MPRLAQLPQVPPHSGGSISRTNQHSTRAAQTHTSSKPPSPCPWKDLNSDPASLNGESARPEWQCLCINGALPWLAHLSKGNQCWQQHTPTAYTGKSLQHTQEKAYSTHKRKQHPTPTAVLAAKSHTNRAAAALAIKQRSSR